MVKWGKLHFPVFLFSSFIVGFLSQDLLQYFIPRSSKIFSSQDLLQYSQNNVGPDLFCAAVTKVPEKKYIGIKKLKIYFLCLSKLTMIQFINVDNDSMLKKVFHLTTVSCPPTSSVLSTSRCVSKYGSPSSDYSRLFQYLYQHVWRKQFTCRIYPFWNIIVLYNVLLCNCVCFCS